MKTHKEKIICPNCGTKQWANVEHTLPWYWNFTHKCKNCDYVIMESEWQINNKTWVETQTTLMLKRFRIQLIKQIMSGKPINYKNNIMESEWEEVSGAKKETGCLVIGILIVLIILLTL